jgi:hypothetical protein
MLIMHCGREISCFLMTLVRYGSLDKELANKNLRYVKSIQSGAVMYMCIKRQFGRLSIILKWILDKQNVIQLTENYIQCLAFLYILHETLGSMKAVNIFAI